MRESHCLHFDIRREDSARIHRGNHAGNWALRTNWPEKESHCLPFHGGENDRG
jgi:hypothetical protein